MYARSFLCFGELCSLSGQLCYPGYSGTSRMVAGMMIMRERKSKQEKEGNSQRHFTGGDGR